METKSLGELHAPAAPTPGRMVLFRSSNTILTGTASEVPAIVTRVLGNNFINVMVMRDGDGMTPVGVSSVGYDPLASCEASQSWRWPPRVS